MKKRLKGLLSFILAAIMIFAVQVPAFADDTQQSTDMYVCITGITGYNGTHYDSMKSGDGIMSESFTLPDVHEATSYNGYELPNANAYSSVKYYLWTQDNYSTVSNGEEITTDSGFIQLTSAQYSSHKYDWYMGDIYQRTLCPVLEVNVTEKQFNLEFVSLDGTSHKSENATLSTIYQDIYKYNTSCYYEIYSGGEWADRVSSDELSYHNGYLSTLYAYEFPASVDFNKDIKIVQMEYPTVNVKVFDGSLSDDSPEDLGSVKMDEIASNLDTGIYDFYRDSEYIFSVYNGASNAESICSLLDDPSDTRDIEIVKNSSQHVMYYSFEGYDELDETIKPVNLACKKLEFQALKYDETKIIADQLPTRAFYKVNSWRVWAGNEKSGTSGWLFTKNSSELDDFANAELYRYYLVADTTPIDYSIPLYDMTGADTGKTLTINADTAETLKFSSDVENYGFEFYYTFADLGDVYDGSDVWYAIEQVGEDFDASKAKMVALEKKEEPTTTEPETTTPAKSDDTTKDTSSNETVTSVDEKEDAKIVIDDTSVVSKDILESVKGKDENIVVVLDNGIEWIINGKDITDTNLKDIDLSVETGAKAGKSIPVDVINKVTGEKSSLNLSLNYSGSFGFKATLKINLDAKNKNLYANLYYYNESTKNLEFSCSSVIDSKGDARLSFSHASDYVIVISDKDLNPAVTDKVDVKTGSGTRTVIPFVVIAFVAVIGTCVILTKKKLKIISY